MNPLIRRIMESAAAWSFLNTAMRVGAQAFLLPLLLQRLPPEHVGLWYVFGALAAFTTLLDLGFEPTIARMVSYAWAGATRLQSFGIGEESPASPCDPNRILLLQLVATFRSYYRVIGLGILVVLIGGGGVWVWQKTESLPDASMLRWAWVAYAIGAGFNFSSGRWPALLAGIGALRASQQIGILSMSLYFAVAIAGVLLGFGLPALVAAVVATGVLAQALGRVFFVRIAGLAQGLPSATFHKEVFAAIWPNAWRTGLVSLGAFLIIQANTLVCSAFLDLRTTASYGISLQFVTLLVSVSSVWVQVKMPLINQLRLAGDRRAIAITFVARVRLTILCYAVGGVFLWFLAPVFLRMIGSKTTLLSPELLGVMLLIQFLEMHHSLYGWLVLSENHNPFLRPALASGILIVISAIVLTPRFGVWGLLLASGCVQLAFNNWWTVLRGIRGLGMSVSQYSLLFLKNRL